MESKICGKCHEDKLLTEFWPAGNGKRHHYCRSCANAYRNKWYRTVSGRAHQYRQARLSSKRLGAIRFAAKKRGIPFEISKEFFAWLVKQPCEYCRYPIELTGSGMDRKNSSLGYTDDNVVPSCRVCNAAKSDFFTFEEMKALGSVIRDLRQRRKFS